MKIYPVIVLSKVKATGTIESFVAEDDVVLGAPVQLGEQLERELIEGLKPADATGQFVVNTTVPNDPAKEVAEREFILKKGEIGRGHVLSQGDRIRITSDIFGDEAVPKKGDVLVPKVGEYGWEIASDESESTLKLEVMHDDLIVDNREAVELRVL